MSLSPIPPNFTMRPTGIRALDQHMKASTRNDHPQYQLATDTPWFLPETYGAVGDGSTDDTDAVNAAIAAAAAAGGGTVLFGPKTYLCSGALINPAGITQTTTVTILGTPGVVFPVQPSIRLTSFAGSLYTPYTSIVGNGAVLDLRYAGGDAFSSIAKIDTRGSGFLEIDHLTLKSGGSDNYKFFQTTNTTCFIHDNTIIGNQAESGTSCSQIVFVLGGTTAPYSATTVGTGNNCVFQGYGTKFSCNTYQNIFNAVVFQSAANNVVVEDELVTGSCGGTQTDSGNGCAAPYLFNTNSSLGGNIIRGCIVEAGAYDAAFACIGSAKSNRFESVASADAVGGSMGYFGAGATGHILMNLYSDPAVPWGPSGPTPGQTRVGYDSGWDSISTGLSDITNCEVRRLDDVIYLRGVTLTTGGTPSFHLPGGTLYAPSQSLGIGTYGNAGAGSIIAVNIAIDNTGLVTITPDAGTAVSFGMDGISYPANDLG